MDEKACIDNLLSLFNRAPTAWHAVAEISESLKKRGFTELFEGDSWKLEAGKAYFVSRNGSSLIAFVTPKKTPKKAHIAAAHTDSPALKLKPRAEYRHENMTMLGVEVYGGPLLNSWLNRDLGIAGRVAIEDEDGKMQLALVDLRRHPVIVPQLAIHLDRKIGEQGLQLDKQKHLSALAALDDKGPAPYLERCLAEVLTFKSLYSHDLFLFPLEEARLVGAHGQMIASYRYDNLGSSHAAIEGLLGAMEPDESLLKCAVLWDNEEVGSATAHGAASPFLEHALERAVLALGYEREDYLRMLSQSLCLSIDQAHALHPNYPERHDPQHGPLLGEGIVIKHNAQKRYASDADTAGFIAALCKHHRISFQDFISRGDIPCGSTIGPIHASRTGIATVDVGCPQLSMHACRELAAVEDHLSMCRLSTAFLSA